ncbi:hypothetical protein Ahy_B07g086955 [Arachis hypogaea]|uniref:Uncharacterized protein n=1 Tax=Arachis hypogaea TaxID=3818 RepID=A0A444YAY0_ARAHY|nr:hypothetical protein Ahy_B07g086955 [Arachis hypogaea]
MDKTEIKERWYKERQSRKTPSSSSPSMGTDIQYYPYMANYNAYQPLINNLLYLETVFIPQSILTVLNVISTQGVGVPRVSIRGTHTSILPEMSRQIPVGTSSPNIVESLAIFRQQIEDIHHDLLSKSSTMCKKLYATDFNDRREVKFFGGQPIGPTIEVVSNLNQLLDTTVRNSHFVILLYTS